MAKFCSHNILTILLVPHFDCKVGIVFVCQVSDTIARLETIYRTVVSFVDVFDHHNVTDDRIDNTMFADIDPMQFALLALQQN